MSFTAVCDLAEPVSSPAMTAASRSSVMPAGLPAAVFP